MYLSRANLRLPRRLPVCCSIKVNVKSYSRNKPCGQRGRGGGIRIPILNFGVNGVSGQCQPTGKDVGTNCTEGWVGPRAGLDGP